MRYLLLCAVSLSYALAPHAGFAQTTPDPKSFNDLLAYVYDHNPTLQAARMELEATQELYPQARSNWLPDVTAKSSIYATDVESSNFGTGDGATTKDIFLNLDQPLFRGGRTMAEVGRAKALIRSQEASLRQTEQEIFLDTVIASMNVVRDRALLDLRKGNEDVLLTELRATWERREIGDITDTDVNQARTRLARSSANTIAAGSQSESSEAVFRQITGFNAPRTMVTPAHAFELPETLEGMIKLAEEQNPEIWIAAHEHKASEHSVDGTFGETLPEISAFASFNREYDPQPGIVDESQTETIGVRATISLYQGGALRSRIREAKSKEQKRFIQIRETRERIRQEVTSNWRNYIAAQAETKSRGVQIDAAQQALGGVREEARIGQRTVLDILDADQELIDARAAQVQAQRDETVALYALAASLGLLTSENLGIVKAPAPSVVSLAAPPAMAPAAAPPPPKKMAQETPESAPMETASIEPLPAAKAPAVEKGKKLGPWR